MAQRLDNTPPRRVGQGLESIKMHHNVYAYRCI
jgi:hypothetical protein